MDTKYVIDVFFQILNKLNHEIGCWNELWLKVHNYLCVAFLLVILFVVVLKRNLFQPKVFLISRRSSGWSSTDRNLSLQRAENPSVNHIPVLKVHNSVNINLS